MSKTRLLLCITLAFLLLTSCMAGSGKNHPEKPAGFFMGIWHGWIAPFALIVRVFQILVSSDADPIRIYEVHNRGFLYDLGFYMAIVGGFGSLQLSRKKAKTKRDLSPTRVKATKVEVSINTTDTDDKEQ